MKTTDSNTTGFDYKKSLKHKNESLLNKIVRVEKYINRPLAALIVRAIYKTRITPNQVTYFSFFLGIAGVFFFTGGDYLNFVLGGVFAQLSSLVDCADGQLARAKNICSPYGAHLDIFFDRIIDFSLIAGITVGLYVSTNSIFLMVAGLMTANLYLLQILLYYQTKRYTKNIKTGETSEARSLLLMMMCVFAIANRLDIFIYLLLAETVVVNLFRICSFIRMGYKQ